MQHGVLPREMDMEDAGQLKLDLRALARAAAEELVKLPGLQHPDQRLLESLVVLHGSILSHPRQNAGSACVGSPATLDIVDVKGP